jgi:DNA mismatch repair protein MutL
VKDLFFNTPARKKFLKTPQTEGTYISDLVERLALSHPEISFKFISNGQTKLHTSGNGNRKDLIYHIYGREIAAALLEVSYEGEFFSVSGYIGKPVVTRGNRNYENYFINGRYIKSSLLAKAIEEAYKNFLMQHQYPFTVLYFTFDQNALDVNVHPTKMELRFDHNQDIYRQLYDVLFAALSHRDLIPEVPVTEDQQKKEERVYKEPIPEPFEQRRLNDIRKAVAKDSPYEIKYPDRASQKHPGVILIHPKKQDDSVHAVRETPAEIAVEYRKLEQKSEQISLSAISPDFMTEAAKKSHRIIGQLFKTYWLIEYDDKLYIIDQHAAHEKVLYERTMARLAEKECTSQLLSPPLILSLDAKETEALERYRAQIEQLGYVVEPFGGREYKISAIPGNLFNLDMKDLFIEMLDDFSNLSGKQTPELILEKVASMSCKAAVKGNTKLSLAEVESLIDELLTLENPYNCPHGRPTIISMTKYELEKKFKRIV